MRVAAEVRRLVNEPHLQVHDENALGMLLRPGSMEFGPRRSSLKWTTFNAGEMGLCTPDSEQWIGTADMEHLIVSISDAALADACEGTGGSVKLQPRWKMTDERLSRRVSKWAPVSRFSGAGFGCGTHQWLCCASPTCTDVSRRAQSRTLEEGERVRERQDGRRIEPQRTRAVSGAQRRSLLGDVSKVNWRDAASVCLASSGRARQRNVTLSRVACSGCRNSLRLQNTATLCARLPPTVRLYPY
jgi:hypothetical protein